MSGVLNQPPTWLPARRETPADRLARSRSALDALPLVKEGRESKPSPRGYYHLHGLTLAVEVEKGGTRKGRKVTLHYGSIQGTRGNDGDPVDFWMNPEGLGIELFFVINQRARGGGLDEHKVMIGFPSEEEARDGYKENYPADLAEKLILSVRPMTLPELQKWLEKGDKAKEAEDRVPHAIQEVVDACKALEREDTAGGILVMYNAGPPARAHLDVMDWGDGKLGDRIEKVLEAEVGKENVQRVNEGGNPEGDGWISVHSAQEKESTDTLATLRQAKARSDAGQYPDKYLILKHLIQAAPHEWQVEDDKAKYPGLVHLPTSFRFHAPRDVAALAAPRKSRTVTSLVPRAGLEMVRKHGLLGGKALIQNQEALAAAAQGRGTTPEAFKADVEKTLSSWKKYQSLGPNVFFQTHPEGMQLPDNHPTKQHDLVPVRVKLEELLKGVPATRLYGMELEPYDPVKHTQGNERHRYLKQEEITPLLQKSPQELWAHYADPEGIGYYAANVPHASIHTPDARIDPQYLEFDEPVKKSADCPEGECCPHCDARLERGDDGTCNQCGKPWPEETKKKIPFTVAVDLDGTLAEKEEPFSPLTVGAPRDGAHKWLTAFRDAGARIIIFTVRGDVQVVKDWLQENNLPFDYVNENPDQPLDASGKVLADAYWDDRAYNAVDLDEHGPSLVDMARGHAGKSAGDRTALTPLAPSAILAAAQRYARSA